MPISINLISQIRCHVREVDDKVYSVELIWTLSSFPLVSGVVQPLTEKKAAYLHVLDCTEFGASVVCSRR